MAFRVLKSYIGVVLVLSLTLFLSTLAFPMAKLEHIRWWNRVCGFEDRATQSKFRGFWVFFLDEVIDKEARGSAWYYRLKKEFPEFKWGSYGHRLMFHWGFNTDPRRFPPLVSQAEESFSDDRKKEEFFRFILEEQRRRNRALISRFMGLTRRLISRKESAAIVTILYDVHILCDYETRLTLGLLPLRDIKKDLLKNGFYRLLKVQRGRIRNWYKVYKVVKSEIDRAYFRGGGSWDKARRMLKALSLYFPAVLKLCCGKRFEKLGVKIEVSSQVFKVLGVESR